MKQTHNQGFILLELLLSTAIAGILAAALLTALSQAISIQKKVDEKISMYARFALVQNQMERDFMGVFIPMQVAQIKKTVALPFGIATKKEVMTEDVPEPLQDVFSAKGSDELFQSVSFVSNNSMQLFWSDTAGKPRPRAVRIAYHLVQDESGSSYTLVRQEGADLSPAPYTTPNMSDIKNARTPSSAQPVRAYPLITGIKSMAVTYLGKAAKKEEKPAEEKKESDEAAKKPQQQEQPKPEFARAASWSKENKELPMIPEYVDVALVLWDQQRKQDLNTSFIIEIPSELQIPSTQQAFLDDLESAEEQDKKDEPKKPEQPKKQPDTKKSESSAEITVITQETIDTVVDNKPVRHASRTTKRFTLPIEVVPV